MKKRQVMVIKRDESSSLRNKSVKYKECQKNQAANIGGYAVDGCREFLAIGTDGTTAVLSCAACGCHRSFHRRQVAETDNDQVGNADYLAPHHDETKS